MNRHKRSLTETDDKSNTHRRLIRRNTRVKHYKATVEYEGKLYNEVTNLTIKAIDTKTVASLTPFSDNKKDTLVNNLYTESVCEDTKKGISNSQSS